MQLVVDGAAVEGLVLVRRTHLPVESTWQSPAGQLLAVNCPHPELVEGAAVEAVRATHFPVVSTWQSVVGQLFAVNCPHPELVEGAEVLSAGRWVTGVAQRVPVKPEAHSQY